MTGDVAEKASGPAWPKAVAAVEELDFLLCVKGGVMMLLKQEHWIFKKNLGQRCRIHFRERAIWMWKMSLEAFTTVQTREDKVQS